MFVQALLVSRCCWLQYLGMRKPPFVVADIRVEGLQRIAPGSVFASLPVGVGDVVDVAEVRSIARACSEPVISMISRLGVMAMSWC